jgi:E3 ubiquitin-protein ligase synoviolin
MPQIILMKAEYLILLSFLLTFVVITNAFYTKRQFYPSVVYLTKSSTSLGVKISMIVLKTKSIS